MVDVPGGDPACWSHLIDDGELEAEGVVDLNDARGRDASGVAWSAPPGDLNVNVVSLRADDHVDEHRVDELDVLFVVLSGEGEITVNDTVHAVAAHQLLLVPKGSRRSIRTSEWGLVYVTVHRARGPLQIKESAV